MRELLRPKPLYENRRNHHNASVAALQSAKASIPASEEVESAVEGQPKKKRKKRGAVQVASSSRGGVDGQPSIGTPSAMNITISMDVDYP